MADPSARSTLAHRADDLAAISGVTVVEVPFLAQVGLRVDADAVEALALPLTPNTVRAEGDRTALWLGPDEWLITGPPGSASAIIEELQAGLGATHHTCVDLSANRAVLDLVGPEVIDVLERGCSLDLHPSHWTAGMCAQTNLARTQVLLEQRTDSTRIFVRPSFADYLVDWLMDAAGRSPRDPV